MVTSREGGSVITASVCPIATSAMAAIVPAWRNPRPLTLAPSTVNPIRRGSLRWRQKPPIASRNGLDRSQATNSVCSIMERNLAGTGSGGSASQAAAPPSSAPQEWPDGLGLYVLPDFHIPATAGAV